MAEIGINIMQIPPGHPPTCPGDMRGEEAC